VEDGFCHSGDHILAIGTVKEDLDQGFFLKNITVTNHIVYPKKNLLKGC